MSDTVVDLTFTPRFSNSNTATVYIFPTINCNTAYTFSLINFSVLGANKI